MIILVAQFASGVVLRSGLSFIYFHELMEAAFSVFFSLENINNKRKATGQLKISMCPHQYIRNIQDIITLRNRLENDMFGRIKVEIFFIFSNEIFLLITMLDFFEN